LLQQIGYRPVCCAVDVDERACDGESPTALVERLARLKAEKYLQELTRTTCERSSPTVVLAADTVIDLDGRVLGKPRDRDDAVAMLSSLSDREHAVVSGVCVLRVDPEAPGTEPLLEVISVRTDIRFGPLSLEDASRYWESGEPMDKAGGYAIQGLGAQFVAHLSGSYSNVVGLPLYETRRLLQQAGLTPISRA
jgi:septum formation protein